MVVQQDEKMSDGVGDRTKLIAEFYRYYDGGVSSVYFWDLDDGFAGVILLKKSMSSFQLGCVTVTALSEAHSLFDLLF